MADSASMKKRARALEKVFWEQARVRIEVCDELEQDERLGELGGF